MENQRSYDREKEMRAFDETKAGVKGLVDAGVQKVPPIFLLPESDLVNAPQPQDLQIPVIDMMMMRRHQEDRKRIVDEIRSASETWGFFQVVNHGFPEEVMEEMIEGVRRFFELPIEEKIGYYSRDMKRKVKYVSNFQHHTTKPLHWRDSLYFNMAPNAPDPKEFPPVCRDIGMKYTTHVRGLALTILELLSEALGLERNHLIDIECANGMNVLSHYYPACPEPSRAQGINAHRDPSFITILLQDHIGGLQILHQNQWIDIQPIPSAFVINIGDLLQVDTTKMEQLISLNNYLTFVLEHLISNDKFKSPVHRVLANKIGPRISVAVFLSTQFDRSDKLYGPIEELLSDENPAVYKEIQVLEYAVHFSSKGIHEGTTILTISGYEFGDYIILPLVPNE